MKTKHALAGLQIFFALLISLGSAGLVQAQQVKTSLYLQKYRSVFLGVGPRIINADPGVIETTFVDDSPSMDNFQSAFNVKNTYIQAGVNFGYKWGRYRGPSHDVLFDFSTSANYSIKVAYSFGWNFLLNKKGKDILIRPSIQAVANNQVFSIGQIENNAAYIQIGETQYYEEALDVNLRSESFFLAPRVDVSYILKRNVDIFFRAVYDSSSTNKRPRLEFDVPRDLRTDDSPNSSSREIDGTNPVVFYNGEKLETLPYNTNGLRVTIGISYLWNR